MKFKHLTNAFYIFGLLGIINYFNNFPFKEEFSVITHGISSLILLAYWFFASLKFNEDQKLF